MYTVNQKLGFITVAICFGCIITLTGLLLAACTEYAEYVISASYAD